MLSVKILFVHICILFPLALFAQKKLQFDLYSPDTLNYDIKISQDNNGAKMVYADLGTFNFTDEPELNFYVRPHDHPFILDKSLWNVAYLKPIYDKRYTVLPGSEGKIISFKYISKYNKFFKGSFIQNTSANTTHGKILFEIRGAYLPKYIYIDKPVIYFMDAETGKTISDTISVKNKGTQALKALFVRFDEGLQHTDTSKTAITILPKKEKKFILSFTPSQKGSFSKSAILEYSLTGEKVKHTAIIKIKGHASK